MKRSRKLHAVLLILCALCVFGICAAAAEDVATSTDLAPAEEPVPGGEILPDGTGENPEEGSIWDELFPGGWSGGGRPSGGWGGGGGRPSGGFGGGGGGRSGESSGVTPGKALTSDHAAGSRSILRYGAVALTPEEEGMQLLTLGGEEMTLWCGASSFTATVEDDVLVLRTEGGDEWSLTMDVLKTLSLSGIRQIRFISPEAETTLATDLELTGARYGRERTQGFVSADFLLFRRDGQWMIRVDGREYRLSGSELC